MSAVRFRKKYFNNQSSAQSGIFANFKSSIWNAAPPSWLDYSGTTGNRMYVDYTGKLTWAPNNILLNSATLATQTVSVTSGSTKILSFTGTGSITLSGAATGTLAGTGANDRVWLVITPSTTSLTCTVSGDVRMAQLERVTYQTTPRAWIPTKIFAVYLPRFNYDSATLAPLGLLKEDSRTNRALWSQDFSNAAWSKGGATATISGISLDGTANDNLVTEDSSTGLHRVLQTFTIPSGTYTISLYAKQNGRNWIYLYFVGGLAQAYFNISTGDIGSTIGTSFISAKTELVGNGRYRIMMTVNNTTTGGQNLTINLASANNTTSYAGDGTSGAYIWGVQLEQGDTATSYIPTTNAAVTRVGDVFKVSGAAQEILGANTGSAFMQARVQSVDSVIDLLGEGSRKLLFSNSSNTLASTTNGTTQLDATIGGAGTWTGGAVRAAVGWNAAGRSIVANNGTTATDSVNLGTANNVALFGAGNGTIESIGLYTNKLSDLALKYKSSISSPY